ncbi:MAG TPA: TIGR04063 family PEP-CTERM/XrtA system glycosyltransferase [Burkholderiaceae bacterium]|nr:TIGR04063 family PEP-CTERM/XrtA system glycosyltransferase [Burkholderiaceae bacterium]
MRILHILDHSLPLHSGYSFRTLAILREQRALGWDTVHLTTPRHGATGTEQENIEGWSFYRTTLAPRSLLSKLPGFGTYVAEMLATARRLDQLVQATRPDILHAHSPVLNALPALWVGRRRSVPVVYEIRALWEDGAVDHGTTGRNSLRYRVSRALETFAIRCSDQVTTICNGLRDEIARRGIDARKLTVIPNGVDTQSFSVIDAPDSELKAQLSLGDATVLGFIGSFYGYEGLDLLIEGFARLARRFELRLLLVGGGPAEPALRAAVERHGLSKRVIFAGRVPHGEVQRYYSVIDLLVYPRHRVRVTELVTPLKPLEAMAQGRLLLASDVGGHRELICDGETGFLFPAGSVGGLVDRIERILESSDRCRLVRQRARAFVERERTWAASVARYAMVYEAALARGHSMQRADTAER